MAALHNQWLKFVRKVSASARGFSIWRDKVLLIFENTPKENRGYALIVFRMPDLKTWQSFVPTSDMHGNRIVDCCILVTALQSDYKETFRIVIEYKHLTDRLMTSTDLL